MLEILKTHLFEILVGSGGIGALGGWWNERNKRKQELERAKTQNIQAVVDLYQEALTDLKGRYDGTILEMKSQYDLKFATLESDVKKLRENVNLWKAKYSSLKKEFDDYRQKHE